MVGVFIFMIGIYKITSPTNKIYIGQSINIEKRFLDYKKLRCKSQIALYNSFVKHGIETHLFEIIEDCEIELLNERERYWQDFYNVLESGLNCKLTNTKDKNGCHNDITKIKIRKAKPSI
jgi:group I intron endonuclease